MLKNIYRWFKFQFSVNWIKTIYFNFRKFPFRIAIKLPIYFYGNVKFSCLKGKVLIEAPIKRAMIGFGQQFELNRKSKGNAELNLVGTLIFRGHVQIGKDYFIFINNNAYAEIGHLSTLGSSSKLICFGEIILKEYVQIGFESQLIDTNFHPMINTITKKQQPMTFQIHIGAYNFIGNRTSIMGKTNTPNFCTIASNTLCNKSYLNLGENILVGGIPAKLIMENISRDWEGERDHLEDLLIIKKG